MSIQRQLIRGNNTQVEAATLLAAQYAFDTTKNEATVGNGALAGGVRLAKKNLKESLAPAQIVANTNDYNPAGLKHAGILFVNVDAAHDLTGLVPTTTGDTTDGREIELYNTGTLALTLKDQNASSAAANRFDLGGADVVLSAKTNIKLRYSNAASRWQMVSSTVGSAVSASAVLARTLAASSQGFSMINGTIVESHAGSAATFAIKTLAGADPSVSDPVLVLIRDASLAAGDYVMMTLTAAVSLVISSGSSLGATNAAAFRLWLVGFNDAGTFRLGIINPLVGTAALNLLSPDALASSTAEGGTGNADSAQIFYTGTAVTSKPYAVLAYADYPSGLVTAGTWSASPTTLQLYQAEVDLPGRGPDTSIRNSGFALANGTIVPSVAGSALTIAIKTLAGNDPSPADPVYVLFRNATAATGDFNIMALTAATSIVVPSTATLGASNSTAFRIWLVGFNDAGTFRLGVINCLSGSNIYPLGQFPIASSTLTPASSAQVIYTTGGAVTSKAYAVLGYLSWETGLATAGTWSAGPTRSQLFGFGAPLPGAVIQQQRTDTGALATGTTGMPRDNTIPQNTEGDQYMSLSITPTSAPNLLVARARLHLTVSTGNCSSAMFRDATANALVAALQTVTAPNMGQHDLDTIQLAGSTSATTFKVRAGPDTGATTSFNGESGVGRYGGVMNSFMEIREIMA